jgi:hypothetical protein
MIRLARFLWELACFLLQIFVIGWCVVWGIVGLIFVYAAYFAS